MNANLQRLRTRLNRAVGHENTHVGLLREVIEALVESESNERADTVRAPAFDDDAPIPVVWEDS